MRRTWQQLLKVQLPIARRTILLGLNQVIMMAFGIVVIGSLLGTGDTGNEVLDGLQKNDVGLAAAAGLAIVFAAVALDRITTAERHRRRSAAALICRSRGMRYGALAGGVLAVHGRHPVPVAGRSSPTRCVVDIKPTIDDIVGWVDRQPPQRRAR